MKKITYEKLHKKHLVRRPLVFGILGSLILLSLYFLIVTLANSFQHSVEEFIRIWYWILLLVVGFGVQVGLYAYTKGFVKVRNIVGATGSVAATGGVSTASMVACCAHHAADVLPIIGLSAAAIFLNKYQVLFIVVGVLSNLIGMGWMLIIIQKHTLYRENVGYLRKLMQFDMKKSFYYVLSFSVLIFLIALYFVGG